VTSASGADPELPLVFYCGGARCHASLAEVRAALASGRQEVRALRGGLQAWVADGGFTVVTPQHLAAVRAAGERVLVVDVREVGGGTIPGAVHVPVAAMRWQLFAGEAWMPPLVFVGADGVDEAPVAAARKVVAWRFRHEDLPWVPVHVLAGGVAGWAAAGEPTAPLADAPANFGYTPDAERGEVSRAEFDALWARRGGDAVLLDVRGPLARPPDWVVHIPLEELPHRVAELPPDRPIVVYCTLGFRSAIARQILAPLGYDVRVLNASPELGE
jgi:rhodanese-related sulfurtransferase